MEQFPEKNPNPLLSVTKDGIVNYSNNAAVPLLHEWGVRVGGNLPSNMTDLAQRVISLNSPEKLEVKVGNKVYLVVFSPLPEREFVNISGFVITEQREREEKIQENEEKYSYIVATTRDSDIIERKRAEEALFQSEQNYRLLYETMLQGVVYQDANGKIISMNPAAERILGKTSGEFLGSSSVDEEYYTIREDGSIFPGLEHPAMVSLQTGQKVQDVVMGVYNPRKKCYLWINISAVPLFRSGEDKPFQVYTLFEDITERKQMEKQTRLRAQELETIMEVVPAPILISHDLEGYNITGNRMANEFYRAEVGENISASVPKGGRFFYKGKELRADELPVQQAAKKNIDLRNVELAALLPSGEQRIITVSASPLYNTEGQVRGSVGAFIDITERKKAEAKLEETLKNLENVVKERTSELENAYKSLKESEKDLAETQRIAHLGSWNWNLLTDKISWSDGMYRIFGLKPQEDISLDKILNYVHPDDRDYLLGVYKESLKRKKPSGLIVFRIISPDGETRVIHGRSEVIFNEENKPVQIRGADQDFTELKKAEEALRESEERFNLAAKAAQEGVWDWNIETDEVWYSSRYKEMLGYSEGEIEHHVSAWLRLLHPEDKERSLQLVDAVMRGERNYELEFRLRHKDGHYLDILSRGYPIRRESDGKIVRIVGTHFDLTDRKEAEEALRKSNEQYSIKLYSILSVKALHIAKQSMMSMVHSVIY